MHSVLYLGQGNGWKDRSYGLQPPPCIASSKFSPGASIITLEYSSQKIDIYRLDHAGMATVDVRGYRAFGLSKHNKIMQPSGRRQRMRGRSPAT